MNPRSRKLRLPWHRFSPWMINNFTACHLRGFLETILREPSDKNPQAALGIALHSVFQRFMTPHKKTGRFPFDTEKKLLGAWSGLWWGAIDRPEQPARHGFDGFHSDPSSVKWRSATQPGELYGQGVNILKMFFERYAERRHDGIPRIVEKDFTYQWDGLPIGGRIDRIDLESDGAVVYDYKPWPMREHEATSGIQMTMYQFGYQMHIRHQRPNYPPFKALRVYAYRTGEEVELPARHIQDFGVMRQRVFEILWMLKGTLLGEKVPSVVLNQFVFIDPRIAQSDDLKPRLPRGEHCTYCSYFQECRSWEIKPHPSARVRFLQHRRARYDALNPDQLRLMLADLPLVVHGRRSYTSVIDHFAPEQQVFGF